MSRSGGTADDPGDPQLAAKKEAGAAAADRFVRSGMRLGLGSGSTAIWAVHRIAELLDAGKLTDIAGVPTSPATEELANQLGVPLTTLDEYPRLDVDIDGADEVSPDLDLIKGGGGAHLREMVVAQASDHLVIVVDDTKLVPALGATHALPVEVLPMAERPEREFLESLGASVVKRTTPDRGVFLTAQGNPILDAAFGPIANPAALKLRLDERAGILAVGLFIGYRPTVLVASADGAQRVRTLSPAS
jgi:ribose 5-phosphate isomerase A